MIDKIELYIPVERIWIKDRKYFQFKKWKKAFPDEYFPKVYPSAFSSIKGYKLRIEVSLSKILYGNNLLEIDFARVFNAVERLRIQLEKMKVEIPFDTLWYVAKIRSLEIGKNINMDYLPIWVLIDYLRRLPPPCRAMSFGDALYNCRNTKGQCRFIGKTHEIAFYNKAEELLDHPQRNIEEFYCRKPASNIFRMEIRLKQQALQSLFDKPSISLSDLANKEDLYDKVLEKYWKPFVQVSKYFPVYVSPLAQLAPIKSKLDKQTYKDMLAFKSIQYTDGFCYAKEAFERDFGKEETNKIIACCKKYSIPDIVDYKYDIIDKLDQIISHPHWWRKMEDVFKLNEQPFEFTERLVQDWWSTKDSSDCLGVCERVVQKLCKEGKIPCRLVGGKYRLKKSDVMNYLYQQKLSKKPN